MEVAGQGVPGFVTAEQLLDQGALLTGRGRHPVQFGLHAGVINVNIFGFGEPTQYE
jgi:hypothetical protein